MKVKVFAYVAEDEIRFAVAVDVSHGDRLPPAIEFAEVGGDFRKVVGIEAEEAGGHPFACDEQLWLSLTEDICPAGAGHHADMGDVGVFCGSDIGEMAF